MKWQFLSILALMLLSWAVFASQSQSAQAGIVQHRNVGTRFETDATFKLQTTLSSSQNGGPARILTPNANPSDLPKEVAICPGNLDLKFESPSIWKSSYLFCTSDYPAPENFEPLCPQCGENDLSCRSTYRNVLPPNPNCVNNPLPFANPDYNIPVQFNGPSVISCSTTLVPQGELLACMNADQKQSREKITQNGQTFDEWSRLAANANVNCNYKPYVAYTDVYPNQKASAALVCNGTVKINSATYRLSGASPQQTVTLPFNTPGTYSVAAGLSVDRCTGAVRKLPHRSDNFYLANMQYYFYEDSPPASVAKTNDIVYNVTVIGKLSCVANASAVNQSVFTDVPPGTTVQVKITITNPGSVSIKATGASTSLAGWSVGEAIPPGRPANGFGVDIPPGSQQELIVSIRTGTSPATVPIKIDIQASVPNCDNTICINNTNSSVNFTTTPSANCSAGNWAQGMICRDDCNVTKGPNWVCDNATCTCRDTTIHYCPASGNWRQGIACTDNCSRLNTAGQTWDCNLTTCICYPNTYSCAVSTNSTTVPKNELKRGETLGMSTACYHNNVPASCPTLTWTHTFDVVDIAPASNALQCPGWRTSAITAPAFTPRANLKTFSAPAPCLTPVPQSGDVRVSGTLNNTPFNCTVSGNNNGTNITIKTNCQYDLNLTYNNSLDAQYLYPHDIPVKATCYDQISQTNYCPALRWSSDAGIMIPTNTNPGPSPAYSVLRATIMSGTYVHAEYTDVYGNVCGANLTLNQSLPNLKCRIYPSNPTPKVGDTVQIQVRTFNDGRGAARNDTFTEFNVSGSRYAAGGNPSRVGAPLGAGAEQLDTYTFTCGAPGIVQMSAAADYSNLQSEADESDNVCLSSINCGATLVCADYV